MRACECNILASLLPPPPPQSTLIFHVSPPGDSAGLQISIFSPFIPVVTPARSPTSTPPPPPRRLVHVMVGWPGVVGL